MKNIAGGKWMSDHAPLPWKAIQCSESCTACWMIVDAKGGEVASGLDAPTAAFIVKVANHHGETRTKREYIVFCEYCGGDLNIVGPGSVTTTPDITIAHKVAMAHVEEHKDDADHNVVVGYIVTAQGSV